MRYVTGLAAFNVPCKLDSCGSWNCPKEVFFVWNDLPEMKESEDTLLKDYGIEENKLIPYHDELFNVANHVRAYLDMLCDLRFDELHDLFFTNICSAECRAKIFRVVKNRLVKHEKYRLIYEFMLSEFDNAWRSYVMSSVDLDERVGGMFNAERVPTGQSIGV